jgi:hypothetical protein
MNDKLHLEILPSDQLELFSMLSELDWISAFYLVGGTALALQIGHRQSLDFDFFTHKDFITDKVLMQARKIGKFELFAQDKDTLNAAVNGVRISFFSSAYPLLHETLTFSTLNIADKFDIALMKLNAISGRGNKKDFIDLYFLLQDYTLNDILKGYENHYGSELGNIYHIYKSLVYFEDAETQPIPKMLQPVQWQEVKKYIVAEVKKLKI